MPANELHVDIEVRWRRAWATSLVLWFGSTWLGAWLLILLGQGSPCRLGRWAIGLTRFEMRILPSGKWRRIVPEFTCDDDDDSGVHVAYPELDRALGAI